MIYFKRMFRLLLLTMLTLGCVTASSQVSDFISVRKKNGRTIKSFFPGSPIIAETFYGSYLDGWVEAIRSDSVFIKIYDVRYYGTPYGGTIIDTIRNYIVPIYHEEIKSIQVFERRKQFPSKISKLLLIGGSGYFLLNLANGAYLNESVSDKKNLRSLGISLGSVGAGLLLNRLFKPNNFSEGKHRIVYVKMKTSVR